MFPCQRKSEIFPDQCLTTCAVQTWAWFWSLLHILYPSCEWSVQLFTPFPRLLKAIYIFTWLPRTTSLITKYQKLPNAIFVYFQFWCHINNRKTYMQITKSAFKALYVQICCTLMITHYLMVYQTHHTRCIPYTWYSHSSVSTAQCTNTYAC